MEILKQIFTWWNSQTLGTRLFTWWNGVYVGEDEMGNSFYESKDTKRRWVIFKKDIDASLISAEWHGWLHHTFRNIPSTNPSKRSSWEKPHAPNNTGSTAAYHPLGDNRNKTNNYEDYEAWNPPND